MTISGVVSGPHTYVGDAYQRLRPTTATRAERAAQSTAPARPGAPSGALVEQANHIRDTIELSPAARVAPRPESAAPPPTERGTPSGAEADMQPGAETVAGQHELTPEQQEQVNELKQRDQEVRQHEAAHLAAAGPYASGGASYEYQTGPDGQRYAVGGEVQIDSSPVPDDPQATIEKMRTVRAAALAPADPSPQDQRVAAAAAAAMQAAQAELAQQRREAATAVESTSAARGSAAGRSAPDNEAAGAATKPTAPGTPSRHSGSGDPQHAAETTAIAAQHAYHRSSMGALDGTQTLDIRA